MNTPAIPYLPNPPNISRASCPDPLARKENYWSSYIWNLNNCLQYNLRNLFFDFRYGSLLFPDKTAEDLDCYELTYDATDFTISICGTEYDALYGFSETYETSWPDPWEVRKYGTGVTAAAAWSDYDDAPTYDTPNIASPIWGCGYSTGLGTYIAQGRKKFLYFDTTDASLGGQTLTFSIQVTSVHDSGGTPTLYLYTYDWGDDVDVNDWSGGVKVAEQVIATATTYNISLATTVINTGGLTKFKLSLKDLEDNAQVAGGDSQSFGSYPPQLLWSNP